MVKFHIYKVFLLSVQLVRPKGKAAPSARLASLFQGPIFEMLPEDALDKVVAVAGDITMPALGISQEVTS